MVCRVIPIVRKDANAPSTANFNNILTNKEKIAYGTKTELYSCSRHMTQRSGIERSLLALSGALLVFSSVPEKKS